MCGPLVHQDKLWKKNVQLLCSAKHPGLEYWRQDVGCTRDRDERQRQPVQARAPNVPNPCTIFSQVPPDATYICVVLLTFLFFSIPIHPDSRFWFAFNFSRKSYIFTHLSQGYCESPSSTIRLWDAAWILCSLHWAWLSSSMQMTWWFVAQLETSGKKILSSSWSIWLLKVTKQRQVIFLWHVITAEGKSLSSKRVEAIRNLPKTISKKQCHSWVCAHTSYKISFPIMQSLRLHWVHSFM